MKTQKNKLVLAGALLLSFIIKAQTPCTVAPSSDKNYVTTEVLQKEEKVESNLTALKAPDKMTTVQYLDGLGRPLQTIAVNASPTLKDNVSFNVYDLVGRESKVYLPYTSSGCGTYISTPITPQGTFYSSTANIETTTSPFAETAFEPSPLNRVTTQGAAGTDWQLANGHTQKFEYGTNAYQEVRNYVMGNVNTLYYAANTLVQKITKDENWVLTDLKNGTTEEFTDIEGHLILSRKYTDNKTFDTYYVYDAFGNLTYVVPPAARAVLVTGPSAATVLDKLCYQYQYDDENRITKKKFPGKDWEYTAYDQLDRPVFTQDGNLRLQNKWLFTKYDAFGKVAYTGIYNSAETLETLQAMLNEKHSAALVPSGTKYPLYETRITTPITIDGKDIYYTNTALPIINTQLLTINYYDNYAFDLDGLTVPGSVYGATVSTPSSGMLTGMLTGTKARVMENVLTNTWNTNLNAYDNRARTIFANTQNRYTGYTQQNEFQLDFTGKAIETKTTHTKGSSPSVVVIDQMTYDAAGRLTAQGEKINNQATERIGANTYNELGQLITMNVGNPTSTSTYLQQINYQYNIRGWLKQVNDPAALGTDLFAYKLSYNTTTLTGSKAAYNGNISENTWKTASDNLLRSYNYRYDKLNRITAAISLNTDADKFNNSSITYDWNGNILTLRRNGWQNTTTYTNMDVLTYAYDGNKLLKVTDAGNKTYGFIDGNVTGDDYAYDVNGNLTLDKNKKILSIDYNFLNLPHTINVDLGSSKVGIINFAYDANGVKQAKTVMLTGPNIRTNPLITQYAGSYVYQGNSGGVMYLQYFAQPQGYVKPITEGGQTYQYIYQFKDNLGDNRLSYGDDDASANVHLTIVEESNYDAFGLKHQGYNNFISSLGNSIAQELKYNGKELQEDYGLNWYDYGARFYDAAVGRWSVVDPLAEKRNWLSPYNYCQNNPINRTDPTGALDGGEENGCANCPKRVPQPEANPAGKDNLSGYAKKPPLPPVKAPGPMEPGYKPKPLDVINPSNRIQYENARKNENYLAYGGKGGNIGEKALYYGVIAPVKAFNDLPATVTLPLAAFTPGMFAAGEGIAIEGGSTTLYRAVSQGELGDIAINGIQNSQGYQTGKLFATSAQDAANFGRLNYGLDKQTFSIIETSIANKYAPMLYKGEMDLMRGVSVPNNLFNQLSKPNILNYSPIPNHPWIR